MSQECHELHPSGGLTQYLGPLTTLNTIIDYHHQLLFCQDELREKKWCTIQNASSSYFSVFLEYLHLKAEVVRVRGKKKREYKRLAIVCKLQCPSEKRLTSYKSILDGQENTGRIIHWKIFSSFHLLKYTKQVKHLYLALKITLYPGRNKG